MGGNLYKNWGPKQRSHWNEYSKTYSKTHFKSVNIKLRYIEDKDIIDFLKKKRSITVSELIRQIIREHMTTK